MSANIKRFEVEKQKALEKEKYNEKDGNRFEFEMKALAPLEESIKLAFLHPWRR